MKTFVAICIMFLIVGLGASRSARSLPQSGSEHDKEFGAVTLLRAINTAEMEHYKGKKTYVGFTHLLESGALNAAGKAYGDAWSKLQLDRTAEAPPLPGWEMHFTVDGNGKSYSVALSEKPNYEAFFTDERGLIYEAKPLQ